MIEKHWNKSIKKRHYARKMNIYLDLTDIENTESNNKKDVYFHDDDYQSQTDKWDESSEDEEEEFNPGDVVWTKHGKT